MEDKMINKKNKMNPVLWFLFVIVIPGIVALTLTIIILSVAGVNVMDWAKKTGSNIPVVSSYIKTDEEINIEEIKSKNKEIVAKKDAEIEELKQDVTNIEATIERLEDDLIKSENKLSSNADLSDERQSIGNEEDSAIKSASASFRKMNNKKAALIFQKLEKDVAVSILNELSNVNRGEILEAMDPELAAELTQLFIKAN